ncbi:unnamed protein product [Microthlaspi erraticum]|uniref:Uncharacterized protein n=1 Tax=Microthlaspi erraticum TaxID=1685480 RepID=A0A6D2LJ70_9BRAS|nr:unnamed protein product [Microthlaspi erraticum]
MKLGYSCCLGLHKHPGGSRHRVHLLAKFGSLISIEGEGDSTDSDNESGSLELMTPSERILRERPVKPSTKAKEMQAKARGRGNRGRGSRGGRG